MYKSCWNKTRRWIYGAGHLVVDGPDGPDDGLRLVGEDGAVVVVSRRQGKPGVEILLEGMSTSSKWNKLGLSSKYRTLTHFPLAKQSFFKFGQSVKDFGECVNSLNMSTTAPSSTCKWAWWTRWWRPSWAAGRCSSRSGCFCPGKHPDPRRTDSWRPSSSPRRSPCLSWRSSNELS